MTKRIHPARNARTLTGAASVMALISMVVGFQVNAVAQADVATSIAPAVGDVVPTNSAPAVVPAAAAPAGTEATAVTPSAPVIATSPRAPALSDSAPTPVHAISGGSGG